MRDFLIRLGFAVLDRWLDSLIEHQGWEAGSKARAHILEDQVLRVLEPVVGEFARELAPLLTKRALARAFPNDPSTGNWG